jgi:PKD repeat protein
VANFFGDPTSGAAPLLVWFTNLSSSATGFVWNFGDGTTSESISPAHVYTNVGSYSVTLTAVGAGGTNVLVRPNYLFITNSPPPLVVAPPTLDFGAVFTGTVAQASFIISNAGATTLSASASVPVSAFAFLDESLSAVSTLNFDVPPFAETNLVVQFAPSSAGTFSNVVVVTSNGGNSTNAVQGLAYGQPQIVNLHFAPPLFTFSFATVPGKLYEVQFKNSLNDTLWQALPAIPGDGSLKTVTNNVTSPDQRFYRLSVE